MEKILINNELEITEVELQNLIDLCNGNLQKVVSSLFSSFGLAVARDDAGNLLTNGKPTITGVSTLSVQPFTAITSLQNLIKVGTEQLVNMSGAAGTYNLIFRYQTTNEEPGVATISFNSKSVVGQGTSFTRLKGKRNLTDGTITEIRPGHTIEIGGVDFSIDEILSDTSLTVTTAAASTLAKQKFKIKGNYFDAQPNEYLFQYDSYQTLITANAPGSDDILIAEIEWDGGKIQGLTDKRSTNLLRFLFDSDFVPVKPNVPENLTNQQTQSGYDGTKTLLVFNWDEPEEPSNNDTVIGYNYKFGYLDTNNAITLLITGRTQDIRKVYDPLTGRTTYQKDDAETIQFTVDQSLKVFFGVQAVTEKGFVSDWIAYKSAGNFVTSSPSPILWANNGAYLTTAAGGGGG